MTSLARETMGADGPAKAAGESGLTVTIGLDGAEREWRRLERDTLATPYARFDWIKAFAGHDASHLRVIVKRDPGGRPELLWACRLVRRCGITAAIPVGGRHANLNLPLMQPDFAGAGEPRALLRAIGRHLGADLVCLPRVPETWAGQAVPLAAIGRPNPDVAPSVRLGPDHESTARRTMSNEARKRLRNKERGLAKHGPVSVRQARGASEIETLLHVFFRQKAERFAALGIPDPFATSAVREAIRAASVDDRGSAGPAVAIYGLWIGDTIAAVLGAAVTDTHLSGMFISFEHWPDILRFSPGDVLMSRVVEAQFATARRSLDFGTGRAHYKRIFCDEEIALRDVVVAVTALGAVAALGLDTLLTAKAGLKGSPTMMSLIGRLRRGRSAPGF